MYFRFRDKIVTIFKVQDVLFGYKHLDPEKSLRCLIFGHKWKVIGVEYKDPELCIEEYVAHQKLECNHCGLIAYKNRP